MATKKQSATQVARKHALRRARDFAKKTGMTIVISEKAPKATLEKITARSLARLAKQTKGTTLYVGSAKKAKSTISVAPPKPKVKPLTQPPIDKAFADDSIKKLENISRFDVEPQHEDTVSEVEVLRDWLLGFVPQSPKADRLREEISSADISMLYGFKKHLETYPGIWEMLDSEIYYEDQKDPNSAPWTYKNGKRITVLDIINGIISGANAMSVITAPEPANYKDETEDEGGFMQLPEESEDDEYPYS